MAVTAYRQGPDSMTAQALDLLEPLAGARVLDFACGAGVTTAWLAARGANVTGVDITPQSLDIARQLCRAVEIDASFVCGDIAAISSSLPHFDRLFGNMALHHVPLATVAPILGEHLEPGGVGSFAETTYTNPLFWFGRRYLVGRFGIPRFGTHDEKPLDRHDLSLLRDAFGEAAFVNSEVHFLRVFDRQLLGFRHPKASMVLKAIDDMIGRSPALQWLSYHRVLFVRKKDSDHGASSVHQRA